MYKQIAILRGINVGGRRKILMWDLKELFLKLGFSNIQTYIQSGNIIFETSDSGSNIIIANEIEETIQKKYDFQVPVIVLSSNEFHDAISDNPFLKEKRIEIDRLHLTFLKELPSDEKLQKIKTVDVTPDQFEIKNKNVFIYCSDKYSKSKLTNAFFENKLKVSATTRNWKTVMKLAELSKK